MNRRHVPPFHGLYCGASLWDIDLGESWHVHAHAYIHRYLLSRACAQSDMQATEVTKFLGLDDKRTKGDESGPRRPPPVAEQLRMKGHGAPAVVGKRDTRGW